MQINDLFELIQRPPKGRYQIFVLHHTFIYQESLWLSLIHSGKYLLNWSVKKALLFNFEHQNPYRADYQTMFSEAFILDRSSVEII